MSYKLKVERPTTNSTEVQINGLGIFANGVEYDIDDEAAEAYRWANQVLTSHVDADGNETVTAEKGPTLLQAFENEDWVTVTTVQAAKKAAAPPPSENKTNEGGAK